MYQIFVLIVAIAIFYLYAPYFQQLQPREYSSLLPIRYEGPMAVNNKLDVMQKLHENDIYWPESMAVHKGKIYSGLGDGRIVSLSDNKLDNITRIGEECAGKHEEHVCGRPLGMQCNKEGKLYVVDAYHGLFVIDPISKQKKQLLPSSKYIDNLPLTFMNGLALDEGEEVLYITQSSTKWNISNVIVSILEHENTGRLLKYDIKTKTVTVLKKNLSFPNGVTLTHDKNSLLIAELSKHQVVKYNLKDGGDLVPLPLVLPGEPDNITPSRRGYWVAVGNSRTADKPTLYDRVSHYPSVRKAFLTFHHIMFAPVASLLSYAGTIQSKEISYELLNLRLIIDFFATSSVLVEFDDNGNVLQSLHSTEKNVAHISEVLEHDGHLYLGSWRNKFLGKVKLVA